MFSIFTSNFYLKNQNSSAKRVPSLHLLMIKESVNILYNNLLFYVYFHFDKKKNEDSRESEVRTSVSARGTGIHVKDVRKEEGKESAREEGGKEGGGRRRRNT